MRTDTSSMKYKGSLSIFFSASVWGLFWIPLRYFDESGVYSLWAVAAINFAASLIAIPFAFWFAELKKGDIKWLFIMGLGMGAANIFYFAGIILSDVVRVIFLFYLLPIWATLFAKVLFNVPIGNKRMFALVIAVIGIWLLLGAGSWPIPQNIGDVFGILAGMFWALGLTLMRGRSEMDAFAVSASALIFAFVMAIILGSLIHLIAPDIQRAAPDLKTVYAIILPVLAFGVLVLWPTMLGQLWGAKFVAATTAALLTMSEILLATVSTALLGASNLPLISWIGAGFILLAVLTDLFAGQENEETTS